MADDDLPKRRLTPEDFNQSVPGILYLVSADGTRRPIGESIRDDAPRFIKGKIERRS